MTEHRIKIPAISPMVKDDAAAIHLSHNRYADETHVSLTTDRNGRRKFLSVILSAAQCRALVEALNR